MKKLNLMTMMLLITANLWSQTQVNSTSLSEEYTQKSKTLKILGIIAVTTGTTIIIGGLATKANDEGYNFNDITGTTLLITGAAIDLISIPFFLGSIKNQKKALTLSPTLQTLPSIYGSTSKMINTAPSLTLSIRF